MNNNQGFENIKTQMSEFISLKKEIGRIEFIIYSTISISLFFLPWSQSYLLHHLFYGNVNSVIGWGLMIVMIVSAICFIIFSMQRLNSLKLNRNIAYIFLFTTLLLMLINIINPALATKAYSGVFNHEFWNGIYRFVSNMTDYSEIPATILSFISTILILLLSVLKGINK
ncbi:hypothetical protein [Haemophilus haemolyticus]|uniref:hypothetical protein n=1 Tax=Haemophilus haemolyticus TaxID=726 RepID=UPI000E588349|nr:hypothetical protein [Haemophilus haemolyticus]